MKPAASLRLVRSQSPSPHQTQLLETRTRYTHRPRPRPEAPFQLPYSLQSTTKLDLANFPDLHPRITDGATDVHLMPAKHKPYVTMDYKLQWNQSLRDAPRSRPRRLCYRNPAAYALTPCSRRARNRTTSSRIR